MKIPIGFLAGVFVFGISANFVAGQTTTPSIPAPPQPGSATQTDSPEFSNQQIIQTWGWIISHQREVDHIEISDAELSVFMKGVAEGFKGEKCPYSFSTIISDVRQLAKARRAKYIQTLFDKNRAKANAVFSELDKNPTVVKLPSGLRYQILTPGTGPCPTPKQTVNIHFLGHLLNGTEFTQKGPIDLVLWPNRFDSYLYEALQKMNKGARIRLYVSDPPTDYQLEMFGIPPGSMMIYEVELFDIKETPQDILDITLVPDAPAPPPPPPSGYSPDQIMEAWGWVTARRTTVPILEFTDDETAAVTKGLLDGVKGEPPPYDLQQIDPQIQNFVGARLNKAREDFKEKQTSENNAFFANLQKNPNVVQSPSSLRYEIVKPGSGPYPKPGDTVRIQFVAQLLSGKVFERTFEGDPRRVDLADPPNKWVLPGLNEGLQKIKLGGKIKLFIPPSLGYGDFGENGAPPYSTLIYDIELVQIGDLTAPPDTTPTTAPAQK